MTLYMCVHMCSVHMQMVGCLSKNVSPMIMQIAGGGGGGGYSANTCVAEGGREVCNFTFCSMR